MQAIHRQILSRKPVVRPSDLVSRVQNPDKEENCGICQSGLDINVISLKSCEHQFHKSCLAGWFNKEMSCPFCKENLVKHYGNQPNPKGSFMSVTETKRKLPGYSDTNSLLVKFFIPSGLQPNDGIKPGKPFVGLTSYYWFPNSQMFVDMISLLRKAWDQRLIYTYHSNGRNLIVNGFILEKEWKKPIPHYATMLNLCFQDIELAPRTS